MMATPRIIPVEDLVDLRETRVAGVSADGQIMAHISNRSGLPQIWFSDANGHGLVQVTDLNERVAALAFAPKGGDLIFTTDIGMDERFQLWLLAEGAAAPVPLTTAPTVAHLWGAWSPDGTKIAYCANDRDPFVMDAMVMDMATGNALRLFEGQGFQEVLGWTSDGSALILRQARNGSADQILLRVDLASGAAALFCSDTGRVTYRSVKFLGQTDAALVLCDHANDYHCIERRDPETGNLTIVHAEDGHDIEAFVLDPAREKIAFIINDHGFSSLGIVPIAGGDSIRIVLPYLGMASALRFVGDGLVMTLEGPTRPASVWRYDLQTQVWSEIIPTVAGKVDLGQLTLPEVHHAPSFDGLPLPYLEFAPQGDRPKNGWPVLFIVHGGPESQWQPNFRADLQHYLSSGIMVVTPNVRGSTGYGRPYHEADDVEKRMDSVEDLLTLARLIGARPDVDANRLGVMGQSYGGFMVLAAMTEAPELWRTGVDIYGISNFVTMAETTGPWRAATRAAEYGTMEENADFLAKISPVHRLNLVKAPLLVVHCTDDPRVPIEQGEQVFARLRGFGTPTDIVRIPHEGHGFSRVANKKTAFGAIAHWIAGTL